MSALSIVVEGRRDADLLRKVLPKEDLAGLRFFAAGGRISLPTVARNILVHEGTPVLVVMDADHTDAAAVEETRQYTRAVIRHVAGHVPAEVFSFVPELEVVFFEAPEFLAEILSRELEQAELIQGVAAPQRTLNALLEKAGLQPGFEALLARIDEHGASRLRRGKQWGALTEVIHHLKQQASESAALASGAV